MSITVDDLVASLSTNHIGQEAIDLAALQVQLSQSLSMSTQNVTYTKVGQGNCNTPMARTPSSSFCWSDRSDLGGNRRNRSSSLVGVRRQRQNSIDDRGGHYFTPDIDESDEDEQMVEDLLYPSSSGSSSSPSTSSSLSSQFSQYPGTPSGTSVYTSSPPSSPKFQPDNNFTMTDPFYLEQLKQQHHQQTQNSSASFFSQLGRPTPHSPFSQPQAQPQYHYSHHPQCSTGDVDHSHSLLVGAAAFDR